MLSPGKKVAISGASPSMVGTAIAQDMLVMMLSFLNVKNYESTKSLY